jgi:hypothetical protein
LLQKHAAESHNIQERPQKEDAMKSTIKNALLVFICSVSTAFAANGAEKGESSLFLILFLGFGALIIVFQMIPGVLLFFSMLRGLFSAAPKETALAAEKSDKAS